MRFSEVKFKNTMPTRRGGGGQTLVCPGLRVAEDRIKCLQKVWKLFESKFYLPAGESRKRSRQVGGKRTFRQKTFPELSFN